MKSIQLIEHLKLFLKEDIGFSDITTESIIPEDKIVVGKIKAKEDMIVAGLPFIKEIFYLLDSSIKIKENFKDGEFVEKNSEIATIEGNAKTILIAERTVLNLFQRLSGIATLTKEMSKKIEHTNSKLVDTRKTTPGLRFFEKYAVKVGGGTNHRMGLFDSVLIKDNHIKIAGSLSKAVELAKKNISFTCKIEVEAQNLSQVEEAITAKADIVLLDNMSIKELKEAVNICKNKILTEASGNITPKTIKNVAETGVNYISAGFITHHAVWKDINLKII